MSEAYLSELRTKSSLDLTEEALNEISSAANQLVAEYFSHIAERPVRAENHAGKTTQLIDTELARDGVPLDQLIQECRTIFDLSRHNGHPRFYGYVASPATAIGSYADLIAAALNANITCWRSAPAGTELEQVVVRWLGQLISYDSDANGLLTSGGSMANLIALLIASRKKSGKETAHTGLWNSTPLTVYASAEVHMSIAKAADILGLGRNSVRVVPCDERMRLRVDSLRELIARDLAEGLRPFCVVGSAGTVNTGAIDPLDEIAEVANDYQLWFHIDGAYGAPGTLDARKHESFSGLNRADSVSLDPHKWLYVPVDAGCLLFRDRDAALTTFSTDTADYIKVHGHGDDEAFAFWDYGIELSRRFRALKIWMTLQYYGVHRLAKAISEDISLAAYLGDVVTRAEDFELLAPVELSICCFRYLPSEVRTRLATAATDELLAINRELDQLNERIMGMVQSGGRAYVSNATVNGRFALRACITNFRTTKADIDETVEAIRAAGEYEVSTTRGSGWVNDG